MTTDLWARFGLWTNVPTSLPDRHEPWHRPITLLLWLPQFQHHVQISLHSTLCPPLLGLILCGSLCYNLVQILQTVDTTSSPVEKGQFWVPLYLFRCSLLYVVQITINNKKLYLPSHHLDIIPNTWRLPDFCVIVVKKKDILTKGEHSNKFLCTHVLPLVIMSWAKI